MNSKWEYKMVAVASHQADTIMNTLNSLGANGWRVISVTVVHTECTFLLERQAE